MFYLFWIFIFLFGGLSLIGAIIQTIAKILEKIENMWNSDEGEDK